MELANEYFNTLSDYQKERFNQCEAKARAYFAQKEHIKYYHVKGYDSHSEGEINADCYISISDENVIKLQKHLIEEYQKFEPEDPCHNWDDFMNTDPSLAVPFFEAMYEKVGLWNKLVVSQIERNCIVPTSIHFDEFVICYHFSYFYYNTKKGEMAGPYLFISELTDEEYILLLTLQLFEDRGLTFNRLSIIVPDIFKKLNNEAEYSFMNPRIPGQWRYESFTIVLNEILEDAKSLEKGRDKRLHDI